MKAMTSHWFADESKKAGFIMVAAIATPGQLQSGRSAMRQHLMRGQDRLHFTKERNARRGPILRTIAETGIRSVVYDATEMASLADGRRACMEEMMSDAATAGAQRLVLELDQTALFGDMKILYASAKRLGCEESLVREHMCPSQEPLLWIADAVAWCWAKDAHWREAVRPMVTRVRKLV